ncbi:MAG: tRNA (adenosine(37)-N6)-threonylcarbamoyltransferase complex ATPase subunit type 1 TsaE [Gammaproteobacteria bacterium]|nr:MAG: tRNA (adenosine(37)-N6)-threonylcarbamoyltransferase complex ATPase subunit type 1 TsaE [Gammaproteobacteria bacterium]
MKLIVPDEQAMHATGRQLARTAARPGVIYLEGDLGTGKTTLVRSLLHGLGYVGKVKSPTYTLVEPYTLADLTVYHLDLYRLTDPEELEWLGIRDLHRGDELLLVEWPHHGAGRLPPADLVISIEYHGAGRLLRVQALTPRGKFMAAGLRDTKQIVSS